MMRDEEALAVLVASGAATAEERAKIEALAAVDPPLAEDLAFWRRVAEAADALEPAAPAPAPAEAGWSRLVSALSAETATAGPAPAPAADEQPSGAVVTPLRRPLGARIADAAQSSAPYWRPLAVAACLLLAVQTSFTLLDGRGGAGLPPGALSPASGDAGLSQPALRVAFRGGAPEAAIRSLLLDAGARIADGPSALGLYTLVFETEAARRAAQAIFAAHPDLVESADPLEPAAGAGR